MTSITSARVADVRRDALAPGVASLFARVFKLLLVPSLVTLTAPAGAMADDKAASATTAESVPNVVLILCDNLGYGDLGCYGNQKIRTPAADRLAQQGMRFTHCYSASGVCTPSRAALMTGCYPRRVGLHFTEPDGQVLRPVSPNGLNPAELTLAEVLKQAGYATACIGKWHLGDQPAFLPTRQGFDRFFGIPYSDDMTPRPGQPWPPLPLIRNERVIEAPVERSTLTRRYTEEAIDFITANRTRPFFLYLPHAMPGSTQRPFASEAFQGRSPHGPYGDAVEEIDWSTGQIVETLEKLGLAKGTLIIWTSDNGAPRRNPMQGSNLPLAGWGYTTQEGGMRVPCILRWDGQVKPGSTCDELITLMDWLPTMATLAKEQLSADRVIDGHNIVPLLLSEPAAQTPYQAFYYYRNQELQAVRSGQWKLALVTQDGGKLAPRALWDVVADPGETQDRLAEYPAVVGELLKYAEEAAAELGNGDRSGKGVRPVGKIAAPAPQTLKPSAVQRQ